MKNMFAILALCCASACVGDEPAPPETNAPEELGEVQQELGRRCNASRRNSTFVIKNGYEWGNASWCCTSLPENGGDLTCFNCTHEWVSCEWL